MASRGDKVITFGGQTFVLSIVPYNGKATTFSLDQTAVAVAVAAPTSGPTLTLGSASNGTKTVTVARGGQNIGGVIYVISSHGKGVSSFKPELGGGSVVAP